MQNTSNLYKFEFISSLNKIRLESSKLLPINNSFIRYDLLNLVMLYELEGKELTFKHLYSSVNHSDIGIRNHVMKLKDGDWISIKESKQDGRSKVITATNKLHRTYERLSDALRKNI
jgi:hypothetical protein